MILCLDTSVLVKLLLIEPRSVDVERWVHRADLVTASVVAYPEACAALGRRAREATLSSSAVDRCVAGLVDMWASVTKIPVRELEAGRLALAHRLRGMDAVHLQAATLVRDRVGDDLGRAEVTLASFDRRLLEAAEREGFATLGGDTD